MPNPFPTPKPSGQDASPSESQDSTWLQWGKRISLLPAWLRIPTFVLPFLMVWWVLAGGLQLPDLAVIICLYVMVVSAFSGWGKWVHRQAHPYRALGLRSMPRCSQELMVGVAIGMLGGFVPLLAESALGWLNWQPVDPDVLLTAWLNAIATAVAVGFAEELLFRGWVLEELRLDYPDWLAATVTTLVFAVVHQWGLQLVGLLLVGAILVRSKYLTGDRLGLSIGLHTGWVLAISAVNISDWVGYTAAIPDWVTGVGGNPLAGLVGWLTLLLTLVGIEANGIRTQAREPRTK
ncbi:MAG: lysostaphin resistance A-like protein [Synechococcus sp.]